jgi:DNA-directed RNA polymerase subunit H (RpoH/RPB5)
LISKIRFIIVLKCELFIYKMINIHQYQNVIKKLQVSNGSIVGVSEQEYLQKQSNNSHLFHIIDQNTVAYYFFENSIAISKLDKFRTLINKSVEKKYTKIHLYIPGAPSNNITKEVNAINASKVAEIRVQDLKHYNIDIRRGPHCSLHEIMTSEEIDVEVTRGLKVAINSLASIPLNDAQLQMLNVKKGDVIRITNDSCRHTGGYVTYRIVSSPLEKNEVMDKTVKSDEEFYSEGSDGENSVSQDVSEAESEESEAESDDPIEDPLEDLSNSETDEEFD